MTGNVRVVETGTIARLRRAVAEVADARTALDVALERRDRLIVQARDEGVAQAAIARLAGVSAPHVLRVLAAADADRLLS